MQGFFHGSANDRENRQRGPPRNVAVPQDTISGTLLGYRQRIRGLEGRSGLRHTLRRFLATATIVLVASVGVQAVSAATPGGMVTPGDPRLLRGIDLLNRASVVLPTAAQLQTALPAPADPGVMGPSSLPDQSLEYVIAPPPEQFDGPAAPSTPAPPKLYSPSLNSAGEGGTWAVMIGINDYPGTQSDLQGAVNDANDVNEALAKLGVPGSNRLLIRDGQASAEVIRASVNWLNQHAGPDATAIFFYAGHVRKQGEGKEALVGADGKTISDGELAGRLAPLRARSTWIGIAACYGGGFNEVLQAGRILTGAAPANSLAYENGGFQRSYMVQYMIRQGLIEGRANGTTIEAAFAYAQAALARDYPNRQPVQFDHFSGELDLRVPGRPATSAPSPQSPPPDDGGGSSGGSGGSGGSSGNPPSKEPEDDGCSWSFGLVKCD